MTNPKLTINEYYRIQNYLWGKREWNKWEKRVRQLEAEGLTRSDAQGVTDSEVMNGVYGVN